MLSLCLTADGPQILLSTHPIPRVLSQTCSLGSFSFPPQFRATPILPVFRAKTSVILDPFLFLISYFQSASGKSWQFCTQNKVRFQAFAFLPCHHPPTNYLLLELLQEMLSWYPYSCPHPFVAYSQPSIQSHLVER